MNMGTKYVFTGAAKIGGMHVTRKQLQKVVETFGHRFGTSITCSDCLNTVLVTDTPDSQSSKNRAADNLHVPKITSEQFLGQMMVEGLTTAKLAQLLVA